MADEPKALEDDLQQQLLDVLSCEFKLLHGPFETAGPDRYVPPVTLVELYRRIHALRAPRAALCLSGGGIRSASFALGVIQALACHGLLGRFHYLSTVSGGGYIGGFLSAWRRHRPDAEVFERLSERGAGYPLDPSDDAYAEAKELQGVRANSNFITPRLGALSGDTVTVLALYMRNLLLNWIVFLPLFLAIILVPHFCYDVLYWMQSAPAAWSVLTAAGGLAALLFGLGLSAAARPARNAGASGALAKPRFRPANPLWLIVPIFVAGSAVALVEARWLAAEARSLALNPQYQPLSIAARLVCGAAAGSVIYLVAWFAGFAAGAAQRNPGIALFGSREDPVPPLQEMLCWTVSGAAAGLLIGLGNALFAWLQRRAWDRDAPDLVLLLAGDNKDLFLLVATGVTWVMLAVLTADLFFTGLTSYIRNGDADREWSGRAAGYQAACAVGWLVFAAIVLYGPPVFDGVSKWALAAGGGVSGIVTLALGAGGATAATTAQKISKKLSLEQLLGIATILFTVALGVALSRLARLLTDNLAEVFDIVNAAPKAGLAIGACALLAAVALGASYFINVNRFSLHAVYRNRLIRAFLGPARASADRDPDPFTGFDERDNFPLAELPTRAENASARPLFHAVNMALNIVDGDNLAWQERKAESFVATPLHCGNPIVGFAPTAQYGGADGMTLGTAMAISGAAASPNMGYHSSRIVGFLMMLFNVRLGWWLGNPRGGAKVYQREAPRFSAPVIANELLGRTTDLGTYIYLSDGGHFENLGIYEMVRRRCRLILVSDAGCDPDCVLEDLGNAVRKIWIDLGIRIEFDDIGVAARKTPPVEGVYCALGRIHYPENADGKPGILVYVKPGFHGTEPPDVRSYAAANPAFPHQTTADQWFSESQMESYRRLGSYIVELMCLGGAPRYARTRGELSPEEFVARVETYLRRSRSSPC
jgi:hypothetical protein